jgi:dystonin
MMLETLATTAAQQHQMEPISAHPNKLRQQIADNHAIVEDMDQKIGNIEALKSTANDLLSQAGMEDENSKGL